MRFGPFRDYNSCNLLRNSTTVFVLEFGELTNLYYRSIVDDFNHHGEKPSLAVSGFMRLTKSGKEMTFFRLFCFPGTLQTSKDCSNQLIPFFPYYDTRQTNLGSSWWPKYTMHFPWWTWTSVHCFSLITMSDIVFSLLIVANAKSLTLLFFMSFRFAFSVTSTFESRCGNMFNDYFLLTMSTAGIRAWQW